MSENVTPATATRPAASTVPNDSPSPALFVKLSRVLVWLAYLLAFVTAVLLLLGFTLKLLGADADAGFTQWVMRSTQLAMRPFRGIFPPVDLPGKSVFDSSLLFAALIYALLAVALDAFQHWLQHFTARVVSRPGPAADRV